MTRTNAYCFAARSKSRHTKAFDTLVLLWRTWALVEKEN